MEIRLDLHVHSEASPDGRMSLEEIVAAAKVRGLHGVAVCDHDILYTQGQLDSDFLLIPGIEFSTQYGHLLGLFLTKPVEKTDIVTLIHEIHAQGGLAILAHPFARNKDEARLAPIVPLLDGMEVWNGRANRKNPKANLQAAHFAGEKGFFPSAGSDAHLPREIGNGYIILNVDELSLEAARAALLHRDNVCCGVDGRHMDVARSEHTKLKKTGASLLRRLKWLLFAAKCLAEDLRKKTKASHN